MPSFCAKADVTWHDRVVPSVSTDRQAARSSARWCHRSGLMIKTFMSRLTTSLKRSLGRPWGRCPTANSPWKMDFGIRSSGIRRTWPIPLRRLLRIAVYMSLLLVSFSMVVFGTRSCHDRPRICRRQRKWKALSLCSSRRYVGHVSLPYRRTESTQDSYTHTFTLRERWLLFQTRDWSRPKVVEARPILVFSSASRLLFAVRVEPR